MSVALQIYKYLPPRSRSLAASARGYYLKWWRYGRDTEKLVEAALDRESWSPQRWEEWRSERLAHVTERARRRVPHFRNYWENQADGSDSRVLELTEWPILEKSELRRQPRSFIADDCVVSKMFHDHTSGTTGTALDIWLSKETLRSWYALFEARCRRWYGISRHDRWAILGGQLVVPVSQERPPFWVWNAGLNQLYMSSYHLSPELMDGYLNALNRYAVTYLLGYTSAMYQLAKHALRSGRKDVRLKVAITNAEPVYEYQRSAISEAFGCPVRETYGMAEIVAAASECEHGSLHEWPEVGIIEVEDRDSEAAGDFICTGLLNADMPLIRYRVGDRGKLTDRRCACGRTLPVIEQIEGRKDDVLFTKAGRAVGRLDPVFKGDLQIEEAQIIQNSLSEIVVKVVENEGFGKKQSDMLQARLRDRLGDVQIAIESVDSIPRTANGKFRAVLSNLSSEERRELHGN